jgi:AAA domain
MLASISSFLKVFLPRHQGASIHAGRILHQPRSLHPVGFDDFLSLDIPPREMLLTPILPERSLAMLYAPRGVGKTLLGLSIGLAVASGARLLRWSAPAPRRVLYIDGEMPITSLQERIHPT